MKKYPSTDFSSEILRSVISTNAFDAQSEGTREMYYYDLISIAVHKEALMNKIISALKIKRRDDWAMEQLFRLCAFFAIDGNNFARKVIYWQFQKKLFEETPWLGETAIVCMDGYKGVLYLAEYYGKLLENDPNENISTSFLYCYKKVQREKILKKINKYSRNNIYLKRYLTEYKKEEKKVYRNKIKINYDYLKNRIDSGKPLFIPLYRRKKIAKSLVIKISRDFVKETELNDKKKYLSFFWLIKFPFNYKYILDVVKKVNTDKNRELEFAIDSLKYFRNLEIRDFAIHKLKSSKNAKMYLDLLVKNYKKGDANIIYNIVKKQNTPDKAHSVVWSITDIYYRNKVKECKKIMEFLYRHLACGSHRYDVVKILKMNNVLSERIRKEIRFDSYSKTRKLAN